MWHKNFKVYSSSAGSGKTYTLVQEFLIIALSSDSPSNYRHILAITFTNKASGEMKERIVLSLKKLGDFPNYKEQEKKLSDYICSRLKISPLQLQDRSIATFNHILHNYSDFSVLTIDKFSHKIIRSFARDLGLSSDFEVYMENNELLGRTVDYILTQAGTNAELTQILLNYTYRNTDDNKSWIIEDELIKFSKVIFNEDSISPLRKLSSLTLGQLKLIFDGISDDVAIINHTISQMGEQALKIISNAGIPHSSLKGGSRGISSYFIHLKNVEKLIPSENMKSYFSDEEWTSGKANSSEAKAIESIRDELLIIYLQAQDYIKLNGKKYYSLVAINKNRYPFLLLNIINSAINELKEDRNLVLISDFNRTISEVVQDEPVPFIFERIGERYSHLLIDEFQDTSILQWQNVIPLIENALSNGNVNLLVGDGKQAIYRWRNGEVAQMAALPKIYKAVSATTKQKEKILIANYEKIPLKENWRSDGNVVTFNNDFFTSLRAELSDNTKPIYDNLSQTAQHDTKSGYVQLIFLSKDSISDGKYLEQTLDIIKEVLSDNYNAGDIAILVRKNSEGVEVSEFLLQNDIPVISSESLFVYNNDKVQLITFLIKYIHDSKDNGAKIGIIKNYYTKDNLNDRLLKYTNSANHSLVVNLNKFFADEGIVVNRTQLSKLPLYELAEELGRVFSIDCSKNIHFQFFLDLVLDYTLKEGNNLGDFISWWQEHQQKISIKTPANTGAVSIMTIHKSKGLEFPIVILPKVNWRLTENTNYGWVNPENKIPNLPAAYVGFTKELLESDFCDEYNEEQEKVKLDNFNLLYVAFTRPKKRLYVLSENHKDTSKLSRISGYIFKYILTRKEYDAENSTFEFGLKSKFPESRKPESNVYTSGELTNSSWKNRLILSLRAGDLTDIEDSSRFNYGNLVHLALSQIKDESDLPRVLQKMINEGLIDYKLSNQIQAAICQILKNKECKSWFGSNVDSIEEQDILCSDGFVIRPDKVVFSSNGATIIDYKTGKMSDNHIIQIENYATKLTEMGYAPIEKFLIYVTENKIVKV